jgi:hypothetical protein
MGSVRHLTVLGVAVIVALCIGSSHGAYCSGAPNGGFPNVNEISTSEPVFVSQYMNGTESAGKLYRTGGANDSFYVLHVWGTPYGMGWAQGELLGPEAKAKMTQLYAELLVEIEDLKYFASFPQWLRDLIADFGLLTALDLTWDLTHQWIGDYFVQELHGLSDSAGIPYLTLRNIHLLGSLTQGDCSMYGAWGDAIAEMTKATGSQLMQLRALDWDTSVAARLTPTVTVYHPEEGNGQPFINIGWAGWIGGLTGMSSAKMGISEIGVYFPTGDFGNMSRHGYPFTFMLRDILQFDPTLEAALNRVGHANRTCDLLFGVGDGKSATFNGMAVSASVFNVYNDTNLEPLLNGTHPRIKDIVYWGMDWGCPNYDQVFSDLLHTWYGNITAYNTIRNILPILQTGSTHAAVYDLTNMNIWVAFAQQPGVTDGLVDAYTRTFQQLDGQALFAEAPPQ